MRQPSLVFSVVSNVCKLMNITCFQVISEPFYLNNILLAPHIIQSLMCVHCITTNNWCFMEFDSFGLSIKNLTKNVIARSNTTGPLYTLLLPRSVTRRCSLPCTMSVVVPRVLVDVVPFTWHRPRGHPVLTP
jgi:hypothetical protein